MAQVAGNKLIDVRFIDETNYPAATSDDDIVSVVVDTCWGPCERPTVCDSTQYQALFNPQGLGWLNGTRATVSKLFSAGASYVEVLRLGKNEKWRFINGLVSIPATKVPEVGQSKAGTAEDSADESNTITPAVEGASVVVRVQDVAYGTSVDDFSQVAGLRGLWAFRLRYAGGFPMKITIKDSARGSFGGHLLFDIVVSAYAGSETVSSNGASSVTSVWREVESLQVTFDPFEVGGQSYFYADVIASRSNYLYCDPVWAYAQYKKVTEATGYVVASLGTERVLYPVQTETGANAQKEWIPEGVFMNGYEVQDYIDMYKFAISRNDSRATIYINSCILSTLVTGEASVETAVQSLQGVLTAMTAHVENRMDCVALVGFPTTLNSAYWVNANDLAVISNARTWFGEVANGGMDRFTGGIVGWELFTMSTLYGDGRFDLDCTAGWAGRMCAVAKSLRNRNQLPSYKAYGSYSGALVRTLSFDSVVKLHEDYGIGSVYQSTVGNYIFDVRSLWGMRESYFARLNVMRVCAVLLGNTFDIVESVIHTDGVADRDSRLRLESRLNSLLGDMISRNELRAQSYADVGDELNTDEATHGGRYLNINLECWFIGLVERVNIAVIATDSSVRAEITQAA